MTSMSFDAPTSRRRSRRSRRRLMAASPRAAHRCSSFPLPLGRLPRPVVGVTLAFILWTGTGSAILAWGPAGHRLVNGWAIETLPPEIRGFFEANRQLLIDRASDPDELMKTDRYERNRHYIYLDKYGLFPFLALPHSYRAAVARYGKGRIGHDGTLPWQIGEYSLRLTNALKAEKWEEAKLDAAFLGHYVADAHDPLHTTQNFDGQLSEETGLELRFAGRVVERYTNFFVFHADEAGKIVDPTEYAFGAVLEAHIWVDHIILADRQSREGLPGYNDDYLERFYRQIGSTAMQELNSAAHDAGSYWYTAWLNAGRPVLPAR